MLLKPRSAWPEGENGSVGLTTSTKRGLATIRHAPYIALEQEDLKFFSQHPHSGPALCTPTVSASSAWRTFGCLATANTQIGDIQLNVEPQ